MNSRLLVIVFAAVLTAASSLPAGEPADTSAGEPAGAALKQSVKKQLFVFPVQYGSSTSQMTRADRGYFEHRLLRELVFNFPRFAFYEMPAESDLGDFLANANDYLLAHAQEIKQKRVETGGRYGEAPITLADLKQIVENGYAFVPRMTRCLFEDNTWEIEVELEIFRTHDGERVGKVHGSTSSIGALLGAIPDLDVFTTSHGKHHKPTHRQIRDQFEDRADGVIEQLRTNVRAMDEFSIKAIVTKPGVNRFTFNRGADLGVQLDRRYKVWSASDPTAAGSRMLAFGKVRAVGDERSEVQVLIGGWDVTYSDQVIEDARFGFNLMPVLGAIPVETSGFDPFRRHPRLIPGEHDEDVELPDDGSASRLWLAAGAEYNVAALTGVSELYTVAEGGLLAVPHTLTFGGNIGVMKKLWFRRFALLASARYGILAVSFPGVEDENGDTHTEAVHGFTFATGLETLITPDLAVQIRAGYAWYPAQTVLAEDDGDDGYEATVKATGLTLRASVLFTL